MGLSINEALALQKAVRSRMSDLVGIRNANLVSKKTWDIFSDGREKERSEVNVQYDPRVVDTKVVELELFLYKVDAAIKQANALTKIELEADIDNLLAPIK